MNYLFYDTCSLLELQDSIFNSKEDKIFISSITLNELENIKTSGTKDEETKYSARKLLHSLIENEGKYTIVLYDINSEDTIKQLQLPLTNDSKIIASAYCYFKSMLLLDKGMFITNDLACRAIAKSIGLNTDFATKADENEYTGYIEIKFNNCDLAEFYSNVIPHNQNIYNLIENQYLIIYDESSKPVDKYKWTKDGYEKVQYRIADSKFFGKIKPKDGDIYQLIALDSLANNQISMLRGPAGTGKSYLAFAHMFSLLEQGKIDKIIVFCNTVATKGSAKLGFYPGSRTEKLLDSQIGNLLESKLGDRYMVEKLITEGHLTLLPMSDIRGYDTSGMRAAIYISEAQNLDIELMRLALQRVGEDSICILDGDSNAQVDLSMYAGNNNGMRRVSQVFKGSDIYGEVTLKNIHRSKIAKLAQQL